MQTNFENCDCQACHIKRIHDEDMRSDGNTVIVAVLICVATVTLFFYSADGIGGNVFKNCVVYNERQ